MSSFFLLSPVPVISILKGHGEPFVPHILSQYVTNADSAAWRQNGDWLLEVLNLKLNLPMSIKPSRHRARKLCQQSIQLVNEAVLSSAPSDKFPTILQAQEDCSLTIELELLNLTGTRWASHACTLLPMLELFEQLKSRGTSQMTWHHLKCRLIWWPQPGTISARDSTSDAFNFCISRSGCGRYIATQWFWAALHLINLPPMSKWRPNATNLVCSGFFRPFLIDALRLWQ